MRLCDVGAAIQEVMESYEVEINGKVFQGIVPFLSFSICVFVRYILHWKCPYMWKNYHPVHRRAFPPSSQLELS